MSGNAHVRFGGAGRRNELFERQHRAPARPYSTRYRYGTRTCDADRLPKDELEEADLEQMIEVYRDSGLIAEALVQLQASDRDERESIDTRVAALRQEQAGVRRSMDRYFAAFEAGTMKPSTCQERLDGLQARLDALIAEEQALLAQDEADTAPTPEMVAESAQTLDVRSTAARRSRERR